MKSYVEYKQHKKNNQHLKISIQHYYAYLIRTHTKKDLIVDSLKFS
jgi:hypothetical protein